MNLYQQGQKIKREFGNYLRRGIRANEKAHLGEGDKTDHCFFYVQVLSTFAKQNILTVILYNCLLCHLTVSPLRVRYFFLYHLAQYQYQQTNINIY